MNYLRGMGDALLWRLQDARSPERLAERNQSNLAARAMRRMEGFSAREGLLPTGIKASIQEYIATNRMRATDGDLQHLYATSDTAYACSNLRAESVSGVPFAVFDKQGKRLADTDHPLVKLVTHPSYSDTMLRSELSMCFWGHNLLYKVRNGFQTPIYLRWVNPMSYTIDADTYGGLNGFLVYSGYDYADEHLNGFVAPEDAIYLHGVDFQNDYDGISPAEVAFLKASVEPEIALTQLSMFRNLAIPAAIAQPTADQSGRNIDAEEKNALIGMLRRIAQGAANAGRTLVSPARWEWITLTAPFDKLDMTNIETSARQSTCVAFRVPMELIVPSAANLAQFEGARRQWAQSWLVPRVEWYGKQETEQLARDFGRGWQIKPDLDAVSYLQEDRATKTLYVGERLKQTTMTLYDAQVAYGEKDPDPTLQGLYLVNGTPVPREKLATLHETVFATPASPTAGLAGLFGGGGSTPPITPNSGASSPSFQRTNAQPPALAKSSKAAAGSANEAYVCLLLPDNNSLIEIQQQLALEGDLQADWVRPGLLHVTLVYVEDVDDATLHDIIHELEGVMRESLVLEIGEIGAFDPHDGEKALYADVTLQPALAELQRIVYETFLQHGVPMSEFSVPDVYHPHITLAYLPEDVEAPNQALMYTIPANRMGVARDNYEYKAVYDAPDALQPSEADKSVKELRTAARVVGRKGRAHSFEYKDTPEEIKRFVAWGLSVDRYDIGDVFDGATALVRGTDHGLAAKWRAVKKRTDLADVVAATPERYLKYWDHFDSIADDIGSAWMDDYMERAGAKLLGLGDAITNADIAAALDEHTADLLAAWVGTADKPGALARLYLAGMGAGNESILYEVNPAPRGVKDATLGAILDWNLSSSDAIEFARRYAFDLITRVNAETQARVSEVVRLWLESGKPLDALTTSLDEIFKDKKRARLIAQTESTRAYTSGAVNRFEQAGIQEVKFQTVKDNDVCAICRPLNNKTALITEGFPGYKGRNSLPPMHPDCRCFVRPVIPTSFMSNAA